MKRPLFAAGFTSLAAGWVAFLLPETTLFILFGALLFIAGLLFVLRKRYRLLPVVFTSVLFASLTCLSVALFLTGTYRPAVNSAGNEELITGMIDSQVEAAGSYQQFVLKVTGSEKIQNGARIRVTYQGDVVLSPGGTLSAVLTPIKTNPVSPYLFDTYAASGNVFLKAYLSDGFSFEAGGGFMSALFAFEDRFLESIRHILPGERGELVAATLFSAKGGLSAETIGAFRGAGVSHLFAVSGLHMTLLFGLFLTFFKKLRLGRAAEPAALIIAFLFLCMIGFRLSAVRAFVMLAVLCGAGLFKKHSDSVNSLGFAVLLVMAFSPAAALDAGFILSVFATLGILTVRPFIDRAFLDLVPTKNKLIRAPLSVVSVSLSAVLYTTPVIALLGWDVSLVALLGNLLIVPFVSVFVSFAILSGLVGLVPLLSSLAKVLAIPVGLLGDWFLFAARSVSAIPGAMQAMDGAAARTTAVLLSLILILFFVLRKQGVWYLKRTLACAMALGLLLPAITVMFPSGPCEFTVLIGQRNAAPAILISSYGEWIIAADKLTEDGVDSILAELRRRQASEVQAVILLSDKMKPEGAYATLLEGIPVGTTVTSNTLFEGAVPANAPVPVGGRMLRFVKTQGKTAAVVVFDKSKLVILPGEGNEFIRYVSEKDVIIGTKDLSAYAGVSIIPKLGDAPGLAAGECRMLFFEDGWYLGGADDAGA